MARESGLLDAVLDRLPGPVRPLLRGVLAGLLTALALCTAVVAIALVADARGVRHPVRLAGRRRRRRRSACWAWPCCCCPTPRPPCWASPPGPGFLVGAGTLVSVHGVTLGAVPALPLLAALPDTQAVPLIALRVAGGPGPGRAGRRRRPWGAGSPTADGGSVVAGLTGILARARCWAWSAARSCGWPAARWGTARLAEVGAPALATGIAVAAQSGIAAAARGRGHPLAAPGLTAGPGPVGTRSRPG